MDKQRREKVLQRVLDQQGWFNPSSVKATNAELQELVAEGLLESRRDWTQGSTFYKQEVDKLTRQAMEDAGIEAVGVTVDEAADWIRENAEAEKQEHIDTGPHPGCSCVWCMRPGGHVFDAEGRCSCGHTMRDDPERCPLAEAQQRGKVAQENELHAAGWKVTHDINKREDNWFDPLAQSEPGRSLAEAWRIHVERLKSRGAAFDARGEPLTSEDFERVGVQVRPATEQEQREALDKAAQQVEHFTLEEMVTAADRGLRAFSYHREVKLAKMVRQLLVHGDPRKADQPPPTIEPGELERVRELVSKVSEEKAERLREVGRIIGVDAGEQPDATALSSWQQEGGKPIPKAVVMISGGHLQERHINTISRWMDADCVGALVLDLPPGAELGVTMYGPGAKERAERAEVIVTSIGGAEAAALLVRCASMVAHGTDCECPDCFGLEDAINDALQYNGTDTAGFELDAVEVHEDGICEVSLADLDRETPISAERNIYKRCLSLACACGAEWTLPYEVIDSEGVNMCPDKCGRGVIISK